MRCARALLPPKRRKGHAAQVKPGSVRGSRALQCPGTPPHPMPAKPGRDARLHGNDGQSYTVPTEHGELQLWLQRVSQPNASHPPTRTRRAGEHHLRLGLRTVDLHASLRARTHSSRTCWLGALNMRSRVFPSVEKAKMLGFCRSVYTRSRFATSTTKSAAPISSPEHVPARSLDTTRCPSTKDRCRRRQISYGPRTPSEARHSLRRFVRISRTPRIVVSLTSFRDLCPR
mmetsp:Transcript_3551/g.10193  ORF Transcript_3551/g.10193 Transcript_3551/m.10193 type:complete len:230 (+) Transcript_3551:491-1180(+)